ncbi:hypothetical protein JOD97_004241 [Duganella sp. 1411]|uniref:hypothetical protein n=1 Tax=Duganella sp. 1411 TaxID=2806572 RepID=UPI001AE533A2|nr:hypothetical protein [Duganella sp. 1411]MBP1206168.1 hypothetical protein [Duganella sp. 1411]
MNFPHHRLAALHAWFARRTAFLDHPRAAWHAAWIVPVLLGLLSLANGQDDGWDMRNYHLYNAHALVNGRVGFDLAPAGFQTYFNPTIELPYYFLNRWLPPQWVGFVLGTLHGLNFVLLAGIARQLVGPQRRLVLLLAGACLFAPGFLSELGNTMGDNLTALFVLGSLYSVLRHWDGLLQWRARAGLTLAGAGLLMGVSAGLKLTNATYAVALCLALLAVPLPWWPRLRLALVFGVGVLGGVAATAGWWFVKMWHTFGNPLFPQFNNIFHSPLATENGVIDFYFRPVGWIENLLWPFIFAFNPRRVSELPMKLAVWPLLYVLLAAFAVVWLLRRRAAGRPASLDARAAFTLVFFVAAYVVWMRMFSIYRYLVPLELLAPLMIWIVWRYLAPSAPRWAGVALALLAVAVFPIANWGHQAWGERAFSAELPAFATPAQSIVFLAQPDPPSGWMSTFLPPEVKVISLGTGFPEAPAWRALRDKAIAERAGPHYLLFAASKNERDGSRLRKLAVARALGLTDNPSGCRKLAWLLKRTVEVRALPDGGCTFDLPAKYRLDLAALDRATVAALAQKLPQYGLRLDPGSCAIHQAAVGKEPYPYQMCGVTTLSK